jgi:hypothetical protein
MIRMNAQRAGMTGPVKSSFGGLQEQHFTG